MLVEQKIAQLANNNTEFRVYQQMNTEIRVEMGRRLGDERVRLRLSQPEFAELGGAKMRTLQDWERGVAAANSEFLAEVARHGVDVFYVLTGQRLPPAVGAISAEDAALLDNYHHADEADQAAARRILSSLAKQKAA